MFSGFECVNLFKINYEYFNGFRIRMEKPSYPCKFGVYIQTNLKEYEHFVGHLSDTNQSSSRNDGGIDWVDYEIPLWLMINDRVPNKLVRAPVNDQFECKGLTFTMEQTKSE